MTPGPTSGTRVEAITEGEDARGVGDPTVAPEPDRPSTRPTPALARGLFLASVVVAVLPVGVATTRAIYTGWTPIGDDALQAVRSRDVFTLADLPLIGSWSSASLDAGTQLNHPGPLYFDLLAVPARLIDSGAGVAFGAALLNTLCIIGIAAFSYRRGGALLGSLAMVVTAALCWTMGSELLFEPWNANAMVLPFLLFLVLVWSMTCGDLVALPFGVAVGSLLVQTHLSYSLLVPILGAWGVLGLVLDLRARRRDPKAWPGQRRTALRFAALAVVVLVLCWLQPLIEEFTSDGDGNLTRLVENMRASEAGTIGLGFGTRVVATVISLPPWWFPHAMRDSFTPGWRAPSMAAAVLSLVVLAAVLAGCTWEARRRRDRVSLWAIGATVVGMIGALLTAGEGPVTQLGRVAPHTFRWLFPLGAFAFFAVAAVLVRRVAAQISATAIVGVLAAGTLAVAVPNLPFSNGGGGPNSDAFVIPAVHNLESHMGSLDGQGPLLIDDLFGGAFADPYGAAVLAELQRRHIPFVTRVAGLERHLGPGRREEANPARFALLLRVGEATVKPPPGSRRVALGKGLSVADQRELARLEGDVLDYIAAGRLRLNERGQAALARGKLPSMAAFQSGGGDPRALIDTRELDAMIRQRFLALDTEWRTRMQRYADRQHESDRQTVALFLAPPGTGTH